MTDYLITQFSAKLAEIQASEAKGLDVALEALDKAVMEYHTATRNVVEQAAQERMEAGVARAAAMSQRDHEYHNGRPAKQEQTSETPPTNQDQPTSEESTDVGTSSGPDEHITTEIEK